MTGKGDNPSDDVQRKKKISPFSGLPALEPWKHFVPVKEDFSCLVVEREFALRIRRGV